MLRSCGHPDRRQRGGPSPRGATPDHPARAVWDFAQGLDLTHLYDRIRATHGRPGHPHVDPRILFALWLFATIDGVGSARELDRFCQSHTAYRWLCGGVSMNYHTLADFRVDHHDWLNHAPRDHICSAGFEPGGRRFESVRVRHLFRARSEIRT